MEEIVGQVKWTPPTTPKAGLHPKKVILCIWWDWKGVLYYELILENEKINSNKYSSQLGQLKAALDKKCPELVNRKCTIFHEDNTRPHVWWPGKNCYSLAGKFWFIRCIHQTLHLQTAIYFSLYKILLIEKNFHSLEDRKRNLEQFFAQKDNMFWKGLPWWRSS